MKLKAVEQILKKKKTIIVTETAGCQWLSDGEAFYPVTGLPELTKEHIFTMFDVPAEKRESFYFSKVEPPHLNFNDYDVAERLVGKSDAYVICAGRTLCPLQTSQGLMMLDAKYLRPFYGQEDGFDLYERTDERGGSYFAVKAGFLLLGLIMPVRLDWAPFIRMLSSWLTFAEMSAANELAAQKAQAYQEGLLEKEELKEEPGE